MLRMRLTWRHSLWFILLANISLATSPGIADGPADNQTSNVRRIPKLGVDIPDEVSIRLKNELESLAKKIGSLQEQERQKASEPLCVPGTGDPRRNPFTAWPDVAIFHRAVDVALKYREFFEEKEFEVAYKLLEEGNKRADELLTGDPSWLRQPGLVVRGYVSKIDHSVQPYGLVLPSASVGPDAANSPVDIWFHGRGETLSEVNFLWQRMHQKGQFAPADTIVLHPYGRYCNAAKFAGEIDALEALDSVKRVYRVDANRVSVRGFSMGGASAWHFAVHYPTSWVAANPGAGFSETPKFLDVFQQEKLTPTWYEQKLWRWYDCNEWAGNLNLCPTVAYSGENDKQKQAADVMADALRSEGVNLVHIIGPKTAHSYHPEAADEVQRRLDELVARGRSVAKPNVDFTTYTLRYPDADWLRVEGLESHWEKSRITGQLAADEIRIRANGVTAFSMNFAPGSFPYVEQPNIRIEHTLNGKTVETVVRGGKENVSLGLINSDRSWQITFRLTDKGWSTSPFSAETLRKSPGMQGPIDDAFMGPFLFVTPTEKSSHEKIENWTQSELNHAIEHWRRHFRGDALVKRDVEVTDDEIQKFNLVLWGTPESNKLFAKFSGDLPVKFDGTQSFWMDGTSYDASKHVPVMIFPNKLAPHRYVVLNSSFTFREFAYLNNARQVAKLPDWAVLDVDVPADSLWPGKVVDADFFDENWNFKKSPERQK